jgi:diacylglycerol kinase (ATP)
LTEHSHSKALLIVNPVAGQSRGIRLGAKMKAALENHGLQCVVQETQGDGDAMRLSRSAAADGFDLIVAIGGDGTLSEVVSGQARTDQKVPVAIVPAGTANVVAMALALPWFPTLTVGTMLASRTLAFDVGYVPDQDRHFLLMAAIGYPARVIQDSPRKLKNLFGIFTYIGAGVRNALHLGEFKIAVTDENENVHTYEGNTVLLSNIGQISDLNLRMTPDTNAHDGRFDLAVISTRSIFELIAVIFRMLTWRLFPGNRQARRMDHMQAKKVTIETTPPVPVQIDGEVICETPLTAEIIAAGVQLIVGKRYRADASEGGFLTDLKISHLWRPKSG